MYLTLGKCLAATCQKIEGLRELGRLLGLNLGRFNTSWSLSTGLSMENLWETFKPRTAKDLPHLERLLRVEKLADKIDRLPWHTEAPVETLIKLRESIGSAYTKLEQVDDQVNIDLKVVRCVLIAAK